MISAIDISVVIGFKDWGVQRLETAVQSVKDSFGDLTGEVIVSDYGSEDFVEMQQAMERRGAIYVRTETDGTWSRSRALNAGFAVANGSVLVSTDADMIFTPKTFEIVGRRIIEDPTLSLVLQCRDLPEGFSDADLIDSDLDWNQLRSVSRFRPRWGMGGMMAVSRRTYAAVRGLDERMEIYGGEDIDFAHRIRRTGSRLEWVTDPAIQMFHMWHPPTRAIASDTEAGRQAIALNSKIHTSDKSLLRNTLTWRHRPESVAPLVSVVIATHNRAKYIGDALNSVLSQTMQDFEVIVVDDGSEDDTAEVVKSFEDDRIRYFYQAQQGIAAARNFAATLSRGRYTAVHDDDDLMLPWRLESQLAVITAGVHGSYGGWVDFDDESGELSPNYGKALTIGTLLHSGKVYLHPTLMVETEIVRKLGYDPSLRSGSDYNLGIRMMRTGYSLAHSGRLHTLRRIHPNQITALDPVVQRTSAILSAFNARVPMSRAERAALGNAHKNVPNVEILEHGRVREMIWPYLPDHLVRRDVVVTVASSDDIAGMAASWERGQGYGLVEHLDDGELRVHAIRRNATLADMARLRTNAIPFSCVAGANPPEQSVATVAQESSTGTWLSNLLDGLTSMDQAEPSTAQWAIAQVEGSSPRAVAGIRDSLDQKVRLVTLHDRDGERTFAVIECSSIADSVDVVSSLSQAFPTTSPFVVSQASSRWSMSQELELSLLGRLKK